MTAKPFHRFLTLLFIASLLTGLLGCAFGGAVTQKGKPAADAPAEGAPGGAADPDGEGEDGEARFVDGPVEPMALNLPALGKVTFTADPAHQAVVEYEPGLEETVIQLTDGGGGLTWSLVIPPMALAEPQKITMTAMTGISSSDITADWAGGVLLEPDGLEFQIPAVLTVAGPTLGAKTLILGGKQDGSEMDFTIPASEKGVSSFITHFSTYGAATGDDKAIDDLRKQAMKQYKELAAEARKLLKDPDIDVPRPPSVPVRCPEDEDEAEDNEEDLQEFIEDFKEPEYELIEKLLAAQRSLEFLGVDPDFHMEIRLLNRSAKKFRLLVKEYGGKAENIRAIARAGMMVARHLQLLGDAPGVDQSIMQDIAGMYQRAYQELLDELVNEHEYRNMDALLEVARGIALLGQSAILPVEQVLRQLEAAMQFDLELTYNLEIAGNQFYTYQATFPVKLLAGGTRFDLLTGSGQGTLTSYKNTQEPEIQVKAPPFAVEAMLHDFDPCKNTAILSINQFYPESETVIIDPELSTDMPLTKNCWRETYKDQMTSDPITGEWFTFPLKLRNGDAEAASEEVEGVAPNSKGKVEGTFVIKLVHKGKRVK